MSWLVIVIVYTRKEFFALDTTYIGGKIKKNSFVIDDIIATIFNDSVCQT